MAARTARAFTSRDETGGRRPVLSSLARAGDFHGAGYARRRDPLLAIM